VGRRSVESALADVAALTEPVRRALFLHVASADGDVSREGAARAVGIARSLAAFHLDRLVDEGLLEAGYRRLTGRTGPGAGRPAKVYRRSPREVHLTIPPRDYELAARVLAAALEGRGRAPLPAALHRAARDAGKTVGEEARRRAGRRPSRASLVRELVGVLEEGGFEPRVGAEGEIRLRNCPFDSLTAEHRETVCGMNLSLLEGTLAALGGIRLEAVADPRAGSCCVAFRRAGATRR
jgi:predicted ArsR family transcriptional regulator